MKYNVHPIEIFRAKIDVHYPSLWHKKVTLKRNEYLKVGGSVDTNIYYVKRGSLRIFIEDEWEEHTIRFGYAGALVVALDSFIKGTGSKFYIQAIKACEINVMQKSAFEHFLQLDTEHFLLWNRLKDYLLCDQLEREIDLLTASPLERYKRVLKRSPQLFQEITSKFKEFQEISTKFKRFQ